MKRTITMIGSDNLFKGSIPETYDAYMVPLIFEDYAADLANRIAALSPDDVLETAAGTGVVTRALAPLLAATARYTATDLSQPMLDFAAERQGRDERIVWRQADALNLPFEDASFDVVCCQFGVMFYPDKVAGYAEARRVLRPGGAFMFNVWDRLDVNDFAEVIDRSVAASFPDDPPRFFARTPHGYHDVGLIRDDLSRAGFPRVSIKTIAKTSRAPSARHVAIALCQGTPLRGEIAARHPDLLETITERATSAITERFGQAGILGKIQAHLIVAER